ncbi:type IX secretion system protein PorG [Pararcticibacter amylolyticus]|uniref:DUF6089 domain-containing protein n=1 Tax=Pararcticibacter amylolyticus TaxID=2173175 RepID=A0A2U2PJK8_9SPHI|nr:DUF6089 family protein [Pararcticibacter amylolyticus]PWG81442.1 hypothetical protein DDR33_06300 [Pararcticibacter amylolyticus]
MILKRFRILLIFILLYIPRLVSAQSWEVGVFAGGAGYMGDLNPVKPYKINNAAYGVLVKKNIDGYWSVKLNLTHGRIAATDSLSNNDYQKRRNLSFFSPVTEMSLQAEFNFFNYIPSLSRKRYSPYLFAGGGLVLFNPQTKYRDSNNELQTVELNPLGTENQSLNDPYKRYAITVPFGAGIKYNIFRNWTLGAEIGYRTTFTDYLDDVSGRYANFSNLPDTEENNLRRKLADRSWEKNYPANAPYTQRGDFRPRDTYLFSGITLTYTFLSSKCPAVE